MASRVRSLEVEGFTSIQNVSIDLRDVNVLIGANGAGKSNLVRALELLGRIVDEDLGLYVGRAGGAAALLNKVMPAGHIRLVLDAPPNRYEAVLVPTARDEMVFADESVGRYEAGADVPRLVSIGSGHRETELHSQIDKLPSPAVFGPVVELLRGCRVYHFHDTSYTAPARTPAFTSDNLALRADGDNIAAMLWRLRESDLGEDSAAYRRIVGAVRHAAPFFRDFVLEPERADRVRLRWRENHADVVFSAEHLSDGTLRFICLATLLLLPKVPQLVVLDEPELGLHPAAIVQLADLLRQAATRSQVVVATQSVTLVNQFDPGDLLIVETSDTGTKVRRPDMGRLSAWLDEFALGELWEKNIIGGRPGRSGGSVA